MGELIDKISGAIVEAKDYQTAVDLIDCGVGSSRGKKSPGTEDNFLWNGKIAAIKPLIVIAEIKNRKDLEAALEPVREIIIEANSLIPKREDSDTNQKSEKPNSTKQSKTTLKTKK